MKKLILFLIFLFATPAYAVNGFLYDTCTGGANDLTNHQPDIPTSASLWLQQAGVNAYNQSGLCAVNTGDTVNQQRAHNPATPPNAVYYVQGDCQMSDITNGNSNTGVMARVPTSTDGGYYWAIHGGTTGNIKVVLGRVDSGPTETDLASWTSSPDLAANTIYQLRLEVKSSGANVLLNGYVNGTLRATYTDSSASKVTAAGFAGITLRQVVTTVTNYSRIDNIQADVLRGNGRRIM